VCCSNWTNGLYHVFQEISITINKHGHNIWSPLRFKGLQRDVQGVALGWRWSQAASASW
jgi:hypothetical protein